MINITTKSLFPWNLLSVGGHHRRQTPPSSGKKLYYTNEVYQEHIFINKLNLGTEPNTMQKMFDLT